MKALLVQFMLHADSLWQFPTSLYIFQLQCFSSVSSYKEEPMDIFKCFHLNLDCCFLHHFIYPKNSKL